MRMITKTRAYLSLTLLTTTVLAAQQPEAPRRTTGGDSSGVTAVVVDLVVRDKRGLPVTDLAVGDFEVTEDGVPQAIGSFRLPMLEAPSAMPAPVAAPS